MFGGTFRRSASFGAVAANSVWGNRCHVAPGVLLAASFSTSDRKPVLWAAPTSREVALRFRCSEDTAASLVAFGVADRTLLANLDNEDIATISEKCDLTELKRIIAESVGSDTRDAKFFIPEKRSHSVESVVKDLAIASKEISRLQVRPIEARIAGEVSCCQKPLPSTSDAKAVEGMASFWKAFVCLGQFGGLWEKNVW